MKGIYITAIAFLAFWAVSAANIDLAQSISEEDTYQIYTYCPVPQPNRKNTTTNIAHENDCTKFYKCHMGRPIEMDCPKMTVGDPRSRLHYNRLAEVCDWPWSAGCESCPEQFPNGTYPGSSKINDETGSCSNYYECIKGVKYPRSCQPGYCFSRTCQECVVNREGGKCDKSRCEKGDKRPHECSCGQYYQCSINGDEWYEEKCGGGLHFSPTKKECLAPNIACCEKNLCKMAIDFGRY